MEKMALTTTDIADMIYLADGVLSEARDACSCNDNGFRLRGDAINEQIKKDRANGTDCLLETFIRSFHELSSAVAVTPAEIMEKLAPLKNRILGMFRNGEVFTERMPNVLLADPSVPDDWLLELFAMRVRDKIISFVLQENDADRARKKAVEKEDK